MAAEISVPQTPAEKFAPARVMLEALRAHAMAEGTLPERWAEMISVREVAAECDSLLDDMPTSANDHEDAAMFAASPGLRYMLRLAAETLFN